jgi:hypothetical protein
MFGDEAQSLVHALSTRVGEVLSAPGPAADAGARVGEP